MHGNTSGKRRLEQLISELDENGKNCSYAALVISFGNITDYIESRDLSRTERLRQAVELGGIPIGLCRIGATGFEVRPLDEFSNDEAAYHYLNAIREDLDQDLHRQISAWVKAGCPTKMN